MERVKLSALALVWFVLLAGCSGGSRFHPVEGKVLWRGQPTVGARVIFHPVSETSNQPQPSSQTPNQPQPSAVVGEDGSFHLRTYVQEARTAYDGAPAGEYKVTIDWPDLSPQAISADPDGMSPKGTDKLGGRYADPNRSTFQVTVKEGDNVLPPFELK